MQSYGFFHRETTLRDIDENRFLSVLAGGICAIMNFFLTPASDARADFTDRCNRWVKLHLSRTAGIVTKERLSLLVLSCGYDLIIGDWPKVWELLAIASRIVTAMQYNWDSTAGSFIEQESIRRLTWQVYLFDRNLAGGFDEHLTLRDENLFLSLPCCEAAFIENRQVGMERLSQRPMLKNGEVSIAANYVRLFSIRHQILG